MQCRCGNKLTMDSEMLRECGMALYARDEYGKKQLHLPVWQLRTT